MKHIIAIIRNEKYQETKAALDENHFSAFNTKQIVGRGRERVNFQAQDSEKSYVHSDVLLMAKRMIEIFARDEDVDPIIKVILDVSKTGSHGDGKIFVLPADDCIRIHTKETGNNALI